MVDELEALVVKAPHHGSHEFHAPFLDAVRPQVTVVSSGEQPDHGHPRARFLGRIGVASRAGEPLIFSTELAENYTRAEGEISQSDFDELDPAELGTLEIARQLFLRRLSGIINVRTNGRQIFSARRVTAGYAWTKYLQDAEP